MLRSSVQEREDQDLQRCDQHREQFRLRGFSRMGETERVSSETALRSIFVGSRTEVNTLSVSVIPSFFAGTSTVGVEMGQCRFAPPLNSGTICA